MTTNKVPEETLTKLEIIADEKAWLQSGIDSLKKVEKNGYVCTAEELAEKIAQLKKTDWINGARTTIEIPADKWQAFEAWMDEPPKVIPEVQALLSMKPLWK